MSGAEHPHPNEPRAKGESFRKAAEFFARPPRRLADDLHEGDLTYNGFAVISLLTLLERDGEVVMSLATLKERLRWPHGDSYLGKTVAKLRADGWISYELSGPNREIYRFQLARAALQLEGRSDSALHSARTPLGREGGVGVRAPLGQVRNSDQVQSQSPEPVDVAPELGLSEREPALEEESRIENLDLRSLRSKETERRERPSRAETSPPLASAPARDSRPESESKSGDEREEFDPPPLDDILKAIDPVEPEPEDVVGEDELEWK